MLKKRDIYLLIILFIIGVLISSYIYLPKQKKGSYLEIKVNGTIKETYPLSVDLTTLRTIGAWILLRLIRPKTRCHSKHGHQCQHADPERRFSVFQHVTNTRFGIAFSKRERARKAALFYGKRKQ